MIKTLPPYTSTDKTAEIMSKYRPIAPKPDSPTAFHSHNIPHSAFLTNVWPHLQARPTRTRKRGRSTPISLHPLKRSRTTPSASSLHAFSSASLLPRLSIAALDGGAAGFEDTPVGSNLVTLPLLPCGPPSSISEENCRGSEINFIMSFDDEKGLELNSAAVCEIPKEKDLLQQLQAPVSTCNVITPYPVRPVGSIILVGCINKTQTASHSTTPQPPKNPDEVEKEVESEVLPAVISDSNNKVRMANSAYKEMVGQPECPWLESMVKGDERRLKGRRIGGEVMLQLSDAAAVPHSSNGFSCWVRIDWGNGGGKKNSITAYCDVVKLSCVSRDYLFTWRFHTQKTKHINDASNPICINI
ncbi:uncharacterized protein LOC111481308 [Cucurbita maxima]|uniref:Uncharacterized protein LOC111481308 n=1 Tax=Cucurbita maxima TaxID=3661 RepID=A0A6J1J4S8_CUCMA|nr:uncharacterized protein LOC111481308 [Cucurbita maxima]